MSSHREKVEQVLGFSEELGRWPTQRETRKRIKGNTAKVSAAWREAREQYQGVIPEQRQGRSAVPRIVGVTADESADIDSLWKAAFNAQDAVFAHQRRKKSQVIELPAEPVAIALLSDLHFGSGGTDYRAAKRDAEIVRDTEGMYAVFLGDGVDNFIIGKLALLNGSHNLTLDAEWQLFKDWLEHLQDKLLVAVSGNHEAWTRKLTGISQFRQIVNGMRCLYAEDECVFTLKLGDAFSHVWKVRHKWKGSSIYSPTHGIEVGWLRGGVPFDVGIGGHTHAGTVIREFYRHGKKRFATLLGAYKRQDPFGEEIGFEPVNHNGCGALVITPQGQVSGFDDLESAAAYLEALRQ